MSYKFIYFIALCFIVVPVIATDLYWTHYVYIFWPDDRVSSERTFNETVIEEWRMSYLTGLRNRAIFYNDHKVYTAMINFVKEPFSFAYVRDQSSEMHVRSTMSMLDTWIRRGVYFEPTFTGQVKNNESSIILELLRDFHYLKTSITEQASLSLYNSVEMIPKNRWHVSYQKDLRGLRELFEEHVIVHKHLNSTFTHQQVTARLHDMLMRLLATTMYNDWFQHTMPHHLSDYISLRRGYLPYTLFPPEMMEILFCELQKQMRPHFKMWRNCDDFVHYYSVRIASVAKMHNQLLVRIRIPIYEIEALPQFTNHIGGDLVVRSSVAPSMVEESGWYVVAEVLLTLGYATYTTFTYGLIVLLLMNIARDPNWANYFRAQLLVFANPRVEARVLNDAASAVAAAGHRSFVDLIYQAVFILTVLSVLIFSCIRKIRLSAHCGYEVHAPTHRSSRYRLYLAFVQTTNTIFTTYRQEVNLLTRIMNRSIHSRTDDIRLVGSLFTWTIVSKYGQKYLTVMSPLYLECINSSGVVVQSLHYWLDIPLVDIRWDENACPKGLTSTMTYGTAHIQLIQEVEPIYSNISEMYTPKPTRSVTYTVGGVEETSL